MSLQVSAVSKKPQSKQFITRRTAQYHPSIWGDHFLSFEPTSMEMSDKTKRQVEELKEEVRRMLTDGSQKLYLIDAVQRLGVSYHFETEIEEALAQIHKNNHDDSSCDLYTVALKFRLLRQQGYRVSCDVFEKFKDSKGNFGGSSVVSDARGMLELYEATHLRVHGEDVLEEALAFTTTHLGSIQSKLNPPLAAQVSHALKQSLHRGIPRLEHRYYIDIYQQDPSHNKQLLAFAKLDFNVLQKMHQKELSDLTRWWRNIDVERNLPYARDRVVELYLWILGVYYEPRYVLGRIIVTKAIALASLIDDTYDNYGTLEELELFTEAIHRWDIGALDQLPEYMHLLYTSLLDFYREIEDEMACQGKGYIINYARQSMEKLVSAYLQEAKWLNQGYIPTVEEYMSVALVSGGYAMLITKSFLGMGEFATKEAFEWIISEPKMIKAASIICRLTDDLQSNKFEQKREHVASAIQCYVKQHGVSKEEANKEFRKQISDAWKDINEGCLKPTCLPMPLLTQVLNFSRVMDVFYKEDDGYTNAEIYLKDFVASMFVDSVPV